MQYILTAVCPANIKDEANSRLFYLNKGDTFTSPLYSGSQTEPSFYWCCARTSHEDNLRTAEALGDLLSSVYLFWDQTSESVLQTLNLHT